MRNFLASISLRTLLLALILLRPSTARSQAAAATDQQAFRDFLTQTKNNGGGDQEKVAAFYRTTGAFWRAHWLDYSHHPENYADVMALYRAAQAIYPRPQAARDPERYRKDIEAFKEFDSKNAPPQKAALFVGSSTIMKWKTADAFPTLSVINRGFGGSVLGDVLYFYNDVIGKYHPSAILLYCDNDVASGGNPDQAFEKVMQIYTKVRSDFPKVPFTFLSMKHAPNSAFADQLDDRVAAHGIAGREIAFRFRVERAELTVGPGSDTRRQFQQPLLPARDLLAQAALGQCQRGLALRFGLRLDQVG